MSDEERHQEWRGTKEGPYKLLRYDYLCKIQLYNLMVKLSLHKTIELAQRQQFWFLCQYFHDIIETTTLSKTVFRTTVWKCYIHDIFSLYIWDISKPDIEAFIEQANLHHPINYWIHGQNIWHWDCVFRHGCKQRHKIQGKIYPWCKDTF